jgi:hypothetical protein
MCGYYKRRQAVRFAALWPSELCTSSHPAYRKQQTEHSRKGGASKANANRASARLLDELKDVGAIPSQAKGDVRDGKLDPKIAGALASLSNAYRGISGVGTIDERLKAAEQPDKGAA